MLTATGLAAECKENTNKNYEGRTLFTYTFHSTLCYYGNTQSNDTPLGTQLVCGGWCQCY